MRWKPFLAALPSRASSRPSSSPSSLSIVRGGRGVRAGATHRVGTIVHNTSGNLEADFVRQIARVKVLVVDDHALIRGALHTVLKQLRRETVIFEASNSCQAMHIVEEHPDLNLILLDLNLPDRDGFSILEELRDRYATVAIIVLSASDDQDTVKRAFRLGALGFIPKTTESGVTLNAIELVLSGGIYIPSEILDCKETTSPRVTNRQSPCEFLDGLGLTDRQSEVLAFLMEGKNNKTIARSLNMEVQTVKNYITVVLRALKVTSRTEAIIKLGQMGWELSPKSES